MHRTRKADKALLPRPQRTGEIFLFLVVECAERLVSHIDVELRYLLERRVHGEHGHADIDNVYAEMCDILGNRSAAALVDLAELAYLPDDIVLIKELSELADELGVQSIPTFIIYDNGNELWRHTGETTEAALLARLDEATR